MPTRVRSMHGYFAAAACIQSDAVGEAGVAEVLPADVVERSFERQFDVPMPSICTTMKPSSAIA